MRLNPTIRTSMLGLIALGMLAVLATPALAGGPRNFNGTANGCIVVPLAGGGAKVTLVDFVGTHNGKPASFDIVIIVLQPGHAVKCRIPGPGTVNVAGTGDFIGAN